MFVIQIISVVVLFAFTFVWSYQFGFHSLYRDYRKALFQDRSQVPDGWPLHGIVSKRWCRVSIAGYLLAIAGLINAMIETHQAFDFGIWKGLLSVIAYFIVFCIVTVIGLITGELRCEKKVKELCDQEHLELPEFWIVFLIELYQRQNALVYRLTHFS